MQKFFEKYISSISSKFPYEETSEMGYRADFEDLLKEIFSSINNTHIFHDARSQQGNKPDFVVLKDKIPLLYLEVKNIGTSLDKIEKSEQMSRYYGYANLVLTDYTEFRFYRNGVRYEEPIKIANYDLRNRTISPIQDNFGYLTKTLVDFTQSYKEPIRSATHLAKIMGGKGQRIRNNIRQFLSIDSEKNKGLMLIYESFKKQLVHDLTKYAFADMYAQTLVYGLFTARFFDISPTTFSREEARDLIPKSNPLLRSFFYHITGSDFDDRLEYIVNELCEVFSHSDVKELMEEYTRENLRGEIKSGQDSIIHFYEDFLKEYDFELRKKMGAYYTPLPVVQFIIKSVDYLLKKEFEIINGFADTTKNSMGIHRVQVLDPAVGTGTFISKIIRQIYESLGKGQDGRWPAYVQNDLLPRINGFELMMTPYTIAHLRLSIAFEQTGFKYFNAKRLGIYLTNTLEESSPQQSLFSGPGFSNSIAEEAREAAEIKDKKPIMVVIGNPPYSVSSSNKSDWIENLMKAYKENLNEQNIQPLSDDYIKFIRFSEHFIDKNGIGIVALITNNSFIDGIIHRNMRKHLLETFDQIYILNLHGNSKIQEEIPTGEKDENVFDIQQGVSINIFVRKSGDKKRLGEVFHADIYGKREKKFKTLNATNLQKINWEKLNYTDPYYFFVPKDFRSNDKYLEGFSVTELFNEKTVGIVTSGDAIFLAKDDEALMKQVKLKFGELQYDKDLIRDYLYRPFEILRIYYDPKLLGRARENVFKHFKRDNIGLIISKQFGGHKQFIVFVTKSINDKSSQPFAPYYNHPLYVYSGDGTRLSNLNKEIVDEIEKNVGEFSPEDIFDYIYAVLHAPRYREKYKEFLKINFPRVPYPKDKNTFNKLVKFGTELRQLHLLESPKVNDFITTYPADGSNVVEKVIYEDDKVFINKDQYFGKVPESVWNFYIGGYQPAQKWLKDRKNRILTNEDIEHYQKMIVALSETEKIMKKIDEEIKL